MLFYLQSYSGTDFIIVALSYLLVMVLSLCLHEFAHAFAAYKSGDNTPKMQGRISLNPLNHIDPIGIICCAFFGFGWAKPVQINPSNFRDIKKGITWTSIAGVLVNLFLAFIGYGLFCATTLIVSTNFFVLFLGQFFYFMFIVNISLAVFNLLPIYPLDGFKLVENCSNYNNKYVQFMYRYGNLILIMLILFFDTFLIRLIGYVSRPIILFWNLIF